MSKAFIREKMNAELSDTIINLNLKADETRRFIQTAFAEGYVSEDGTAVTKILKPRSRFGKNAGHAGSKTMALEALKAYFEKYREVAPSNMGSVYYSVMEIPDGLQNAQQGEG